MLEKPTEPWPLTSEKRQGLANQQGRTVSWLAGFVDGEGTFTVNCHWGRKTFQPRFQVCNTNWEAFEVCKDILSDNGIRYHISTQKLNDHWKVVWKIEITRIAEVRRVIDLLEPLLVVKKKQARLLGEFIDSKLSGKYHGYTQDQINIVKKIRELNGRGPSETIRLPIPNKMISTNGIEDRVHA